MSVRTRAFIYLGIGGFVAVVGRWRLEALLDNHHEDLGILVGAVSLGYLYLAVLTWNKQEKPK